MTLAAGSSGVAFGHLVKHRGSSQVFAAGESSGPSLLCFPKKKKKKRSPRYAICIYVIHFILIVTKYRIENKINGIKILLVLNLCFLSDRLNCIFLHI